MEGTMVTALNCIDGRTQIPVINWLKETYGVDYVDSITAPGIDKVLYQGECNEISMLKSDVTVSVTSHHSKVIAIVGHYDCAANPVSYSQHLEDIIASMNVVKTWGFDVNVIGLWVDEFWNVYVVNEDRTIS